MLLFLLCFLSPYPGFTYLLFIFYYLYYLLALDPEFEISFFISA